MEGVKGQVTEGSSNNSKLNAVEKIHFLFVSRLHPSMECQEVVNYLKEYKNVTYKVEKLKPKYPNYSSCRIGIPVSLYSEV